MFYELSDTHEFFLLAWEQQRNVLATLPDASCCQAKGGERKEELKVYETGAQKF